MVSRKVNIVSLGKRRSRSNAVIIKVVYRNRGEACLISVIPVGIRVIEQVCILGGVYVCVNIFEVDLSLPG